MPRDDRATHAVSSLVRRDLVERSFRTPPGLELRSAGSLPERERSALVPGGGAPRGLWLLRAPGTRGGTIKVVHASTARFLRRHTRPRGVTPADSPAAGKSLGVILARFVLDGLLEVEADIGFVSGPAAVPEVLVHNGAPREATARHRIAALSTQALRYAAALPPMSPWALAQRLYAFNSWPATAAWRRQLASAGALQTWLATTGPGDTARRLRRDWTRAAAPARSGWRAWIPRERAPRRPRFKVYVSPVPEALPDTFATVVRVLSDLGAPHLKVGRDLTGILRPDKLVVHLDTHSAMKQMIRVLAKVLEGTPAQGVPLSAAGPDPAGLLSWGLDPPEREFNIAGRGIESWRGWVARQLASYLSAAGAGLPGEERWRFARDRLALDGVDTDRWLPANAEER